ncbi:MAG: hypothetical protein ACRC8S_14395 [Fimbriiglobus sp.]
MQTSRLLLLMGFLASPLVVLAQETDSKPTWAYAHDLRARKGGSADFDKNTPKIGIEFFADKTYGATIGMTQSGSITVTAATPGTEKKAPWLFAHDLRARKSEEDKFSASTTKYGVEAFKDLATGKILYLSEKATTAFADMPANVATDKDPVWHHALTLKVRGPNEKEFTKDSKKFGLEVFKDGNTGGLIYLSETGHIATGAAPATAPAPDKVKAPKALYGLTLRCRKADEPDFGDKTTSFGIEVFRDDNSGTLLYVCETGSIATAPNVPTKTGQGVAWKTGMTLKVRPGGEKDFAKANVYGVEVFEDSNSGHLIYIASTGNIAVLAKK